MNILTDWLQQPLAYRAGWTLLHFLWQGSAIALVLAVAQVELRKRSAETRYAAACLALGLMACAPLVTFASLSADEPTTVRSPAPFATAFSPTTAAPSRSDAPVHLPTRSDPSEFLTVISRTTESLLPWLTTLWLVGVGILSFRLLGGWFRVQRLQCQQTEPLGEPWLGVLRELQQRLEITRPVRLLQSSLVEVPTVIGWLKPVILLPASALTGLSAAQLESILAHELAHIRRNDYLMNILQRLIETVLFYHPAVWWVSNCIRQEREHCCDDWAVRVCGDRVNYARALASLERLRFTPNELAVAASDGSLMQRIQRLVQKSPPGQGWSWQRIAVLLIIGTSLCIVAARPNLVLPPKLYKSTVRIEVRLFPADPAVASTHSESSEPYGLAVELEKITSRPILDKVIEELHLGQRFAQRDERQAPLSASEVYSRLRRDVSTRVFPHTTLVEVAVVSEDPREAAEIANAISRVYRDSRLSERQAIPQQIIEELRRQLESHKEAVRQAEVAMTELRANAPGEGMPPAEMAEPVKPEVIQVFERTRAEVEIKLNNAAILFNELRKLSPEQIADAIPNSSSPDPLFIELQSQRGHLEIQRAQLEHELGGGNPKLAALDAAIKRLREQINNRAGLVLNQLNTEVKRHELQVKFLTEKIKEAKRADAEMMAKYRPFLTAKSDWETKKRIYETINLRLLQETVDAKLPTHSRIEIVDQAEPALRSVGRRWFWRN